MTLNRLTGSRLLLLSVLIAWQGSGAAEDPGMPLPSAPAVADVAVEPGDMILRLFSLYRDARSTGMMDEAEVLAKQIVELSIRSYGFESRETAVALTDLGELQAMTGDFNAAMLNLAQAIEIIEMLDDYLSMDLLVPINAMADVQMRAGITDLAAGSWQRALHISHVNLGPHNYQQIESLVSLGRLYASVGETKAANKIRRRIEYLQAREAEAAGTIVPEDVAATRLTLDEPERITRNPRCRMDCP